MAVQVVSASLDQTVRVWDISGLRKKTVSPGGDDMMRMPQVMGRPSGPAQLGLRRECMGIIPVVGIDLVLECVPPRSDTFDHNLWNEQVTLFTIWRTCQAAK